MRLAGNGVASPILSPIVVQGGFRMLRNIWQPEGLLQKEESRKSEDALPARVSASEKMASRRRGS